MTKRLIAYLLDNSLINHYFKLKIYNFFKKILRTAKFMECIYLPNLTEQNDKFVIPQDEAKHLKALRINTGDIIMATNGFGLMAELLIERGGKNDFQASPIKFQPNYGENQRSISVAVGLLDDKSRLEFALEKAIELGITEFIPILSDYSQTSKYNSERMKTKAVSAIKQCKRSRLPILPNPIKFSELLARFDEYDTIVLADEFGTSPSMENVGNKVLILIGPEGGFSEREIAQLIQFDILKWNLGARRLRAETALISAVSFVSVFDGK